MDEEDGIVSELLDGIQQQNSMKGNARPPVDTTDEEVEAILSKLQLLPFKDEDQKVSLLNNVQRLQDYHVVQIFKLGVAPLRTYVTEPSEFVEEVIKLFEICFSFCYTTDVTKRVLFDYFVKALKFCFPSPPKQCLTTKVVSMLLQLVQVLQEGQIAETVGENTQQGVNPQMPRINGTKHSIDELLDIFETRRDQGCIEEIVSQTLRFGSADVSVSCIQEHDVGIFRFRSEHVVSPVFLRNWMKLLKCCDVSNGFAATLAKMDALRVTKHSTPLCSPILPGITIETSNLIYDSIVIQFVATLEQMKTREVEFSLPSDGTERLGIFFKHISHFYSNPDMTVTFLRLLATTYVSNKVLEQILDKFFCKEKRPSKHLPSSPSEAESKGKAFHELFQVLSLFPDGNLVNKVLTFWDQTFPTDADYLSLASLMVLFARRLPRESPFCLEERSERTFNFLNWLPPSLLLFYDGSLGQNWEFWGNVTQQLILCQQLPLTTKKVLLREFNILAKHFKGQKERSVFLEVIGGLRSLGSLKIFKILEIWSEILGFIKRFVDKDRPMKTMPSDALQLLSLVSNVPISGDRRLKILKNSKASGKGLSSSIRILDLLKLHCVDEEGNDYFDFLYCIFVDTLKEDKDLCGKVCEELRRIPVSSKKEWIHEVAKSLSQGSFSKEVDLYCLNVLGQAQGMSEVEMLQLFSQLRGSVQEIMMKQNEIQSFDDASGSSIPSTLVSSLIHVVGSVTFSGEEKMVLVSEVCGLQRSTVLSKEKVENALCHLIPHARSQSNSSPSNEEDVHLDSKQIVVMLKVPMMMAQLSRIPADTEKSLCAVLSKLNYDSSSKERLAEIYSFVGAQEDLDEAFFTHFLSVLEVIIQESKSTEDVMEILQEMVCIIRAVPSNLIPLVMLSFQYLLENQMSKQERDRFLKEVVMKWDVPSDTSVLCYLKFPHLLWKTYCSTDCQANRCKLAHRVREIVKSTNEEVKNYCMMGLEPRHGDTIRRISCCELEWLVFHSPLSNEEATLAYNLCFRSFIPQMRCFAFADLPNVCIEEGHLTIVPQETTFGKDNVATPWTAVTSNESDCQALESRTLGLTPIFVAQEMIQRLRPILGPRENLSEITFLLWDTVSSSPQTLPGCGTECAKSSYFLDEFMEVFLTILAEASSTDVLRYWTEKNKHHVSQCSDVILKACKKTSESEDMDKEARLNFHAAVYKTLEAVRERTPATSALFLGAVVPQPASCFRTVKPQLNQLCNMLGGSLSIEITLAVLDLFQVSVQAGVAVGEIVSSWTSQEQTLQLIKGVKMRCQKEEMSALHNNATQSEFIWQLAKAFSRLFVNSCKDVLAKIEQLMVLFDPDDAYGLNRLPGWRLKIIAEGFPSRPIDCWCIAFLATPLEDLSSRDVDAIVDLNAVSLQLVESVAQSIKSCIFPEHGFEVSLDKGIKETQTRERLRVARLLGEFINVLKVGTPEENRKAAVIKEIVVDACDELCKARVEQKRRNELYKIHGQKLKALFTEVFGKQRKSDTAEALQTSVEGSTAVSSFARQTSYLHENLPRVLSCNAVYEPLLLLLRRWLSGIVRKRDLAAHTKEIVQLLFSGQFSDEGAVQLNELHNSIQSRILSLENNKALMAQLQAAGYNQKDQRSRDLWSSPSVECPGYLSKRESPDERRYRKKLVEVLRCVWNEWKGILYMLGKVSVEVGETDVCTKDLFGLQASLDEIEEQVSAVKKAVSQFKSVELERRVTQLMRQEQRHRARIKRLYLSNKSTEAHGRQKGPMEKFVAVWENRFLENVKLCSERIPGCYAPNGFHSEKPVLCALSVDNRILTVFKEEKNGRREEIENVEVKLFEAGMYVYGLHPNGHDYITDELWAAFYKMLLEERLVPRIILSNESPGFDWIKKHKFVQTETSHPFPWKWELHHGIVPLQEDYFDYHPIQAALWPALHRLTEFITLTRENVSSFQFDDFQDARAVEEKEKRMKQWTGKAIKELKTNKSLLDAVGKLAFAVKQTIKRIVDGEQVTVETVKEMINMDKLTCKHNPLHEDPDDHTARKECQEQYARAVLSACKTAAP